MKPQLVFGLKDGKITYISDVESGLNCGCSCAGCGRRLVAKKGEIRIHHFAHEDDADCQTALESSIHLAAKEILEREMKIKLPTPPFIPARFRKSLNRELKFQEVKLEQRCGGIIPDVVVFKRGRPLIIEIKVTHAVDEAKLQKIKQLGISAIEVDLSGTNYSTMDSIKRDVVENIQNKTWLYNASEVNYLAKLEKWKRQHRLRAFFDDCYWTVWNCPIGKVNPECIDCEYFIDYQQNNQSGEHYRENPNYVFCAGIKVFRARKVAIM